MRERHPGLVSDGVILGVIGCALAVCGIVWLWGGIAGTIFGRGWPHTGLLAQLDILRRLPGEFGNPARAWPAGARARLPGPAGFYAALAILAGAAAGLLTVVRRAGRLTSLDASRGGARWAGGSELRVLRRGKQAEHGARLALGSHHGRRLYAERHHAVVAFGPPQSGKSAGLAVP